MRKLRWIIVTLFLPMTLWAAGPGPILSCLNSYALTQELKGQSTLRFSDALSGDFDPYSLLEDESELLLAAKQFVRYRNTNRILEKVDYLSDCWRQIDRNPFCYFELTIIPQRSLKTAEARQNAWTATHISTADLEASDPELISNADFRSLMKALQRVRSAQELEKIVVPALARSECVSTGSLYTALGSKAEEFFPDPHWVDMASKLYQRGADCGHDLPNMTARFRLALLKLWANSCDGVIDLLAPVTATPEALQYHLRSRYWIYQCALKEKKTEIAARTRAEIQRENPISFHNLYLSQADQSAFKVLDKTEAAALTTRTFARPDLNYAVSAVETLIHLKELDLAQEIAEKTFLNSQKAETSFRLYLVSLFHRLNSGIQEFTLLTQIFHDDPEAINASTVKLFFPVALKPLVAAETRGALDPYLILSLIRQESAFNPRAHSAAGAVGLMQLMPRTARRTSGVDKRQLFNPKVNLQVGVRYFSRRLKQHQGDVELTLAGYNAGDGKVDEWLKRYPVTDRLLFLDLIPFRETREYVTAILRNYVWYVKIYEQKNFKEHLTTSQQEYSARATFPIFGYKFDEPAKEVVEASPRDPASTKGN